MERMALRVFFSMKNNNLYIEKVIDWSACGYWKYNVQDQLDFLSIISRYGLKKEI